MEPNLFLTSVPWEWVGPLLVAALLAVTGALISLLIWVFRRELKRSDDTQTLVRNETATLNRRLSQIEGHLGIWRNGDGRN